MALRRLLVSVLIWLIVIFLALVLGTVCHEVIGHGLTGTLLGGQVEHVKVLGVSVWPEVAWHGRPHNYGGCHIAGVPTGTRSQLVDLAGSLSTWLVSVVAITLLWLRPWGTLMRWVLICLGLWWIDLFTYTLPSWGLRRSILWGAVYSEPYNAAVGLGIPGWAFQAFVVTTTLVLAAAWTLRLLRYRPKA